MTSAEVELRRAWGAVVRTASAGSAEGGDPAAIFDNLLARHREPHRRYHTAIHVMGVLRHLERLIAASDELTAVDISALKVAALFHDAVYDPRSTSNEAESATLAVAAMASLGWTPERCRHVATLIEATATHAASDAATALLLDADLAILGAEPQAYLAYVNGVRFEYSFVDDAFWMTGRSAVLQSFLDRPQIYTTTTMLATHEARARANVAAELAALRSGHG